MSGIEQCALVYADGVDLLGAKREYHRKNAEARKGGWSRSKGKENTFMSQQNTTEQIIMQRQLINPLKTWQYSYIRDDSKKSELHRRGN